ncbi:hypothetical protein RZN25_10035 [Bacillaceae bacterium S4-13-56]
MRVFPKWFWISILAFLIISCFFFFLIAMFPHSKFIVEPVFFLGLFGYPLFFVIMMLLTYTKVKLDSDQKVWAFLFLLIPFPLYIPFFSIAFRGVDDILHLVFFMK